MNMEIPTTPVKRFHRIGPGERERLGCDLPETLGQEFRYLLFGLTPPSLFIQCLWKAIRRRMVK